MSVTVRPASRDDAEFLFSMIVALAEYERAPDSVTGSVELLSKALFGSDPLCEAAVAEVDGERAGMAIYYRTFSTWECDAGIWLEDLFVRPEYRRRGGAGAGTADEGDGAGGAGAGEELLRYLARLTVERGYKRLEWVALDWNTPALSFYAKHNAERMSEWLIHRLEGGTLLAMADGVGRRK